MLGKISRVFFKNKYVPWATSVSVWIVGLFVIITGYLLVPPVSEYLFFTEVTPEVGEVRPATTQRVEFNCMQHDGLGYLYYKDVGKDWTNNKFGLYVYAEVGEFFDLADELVNSEGGDWGYVLIPYNVKDSDKSKWNKVFTKLHKLHLIPILQLHDVDVDNYKEQTQDAAEFLDKFIWPVKPRYISVYNEVNDARFWKGSVDPKRYAQVLENTINTFKAQNQNFFIMNGAFNVSAASSKTVMDSFDYMREMDKAVPGIFGRLDGWAAHPYPQPNFSGSPFDDDRWSIRAYHYELEFLKDELGVEKELPVFITETGWAHAEGENYNGSYLPVEIVGANLKAAYEEVWLKDDRVRAVTPFTVWFEPPFDHFSWVNEDRKPYEHFKTIKNMDKPAGNPPSVEKGFTNQVICE